MGILRENIVLSTVFCESAALRTVFLQETTEFSLFFSVIRFGLRTVLFTNRG
jgi:hypothetical protein